MRGPQKGRASEHLWRYRLAVLLLPLLVLWHGGDALYSAPFYGDAWFYLGYFHNLLEFKRQLFYGFYYGSRLSWILPGFLVNWLLPPLAANAVLHLAVQSTATLSLFSILRLTAGIRAAFLGTMVFAVYPWLWVATGWDYVDGAGIAYCLLTMALLALAALSPVRKWYLVLAGAALAGMAYTHLFLATLSPLVLLSYAGLLWAWHGRPAARTLLVSGGWLAIGFGIVTLLFSCINYQLDGTFWFYAPSLKQGRLMAQNFHFTRSIWFQNQLVPWLWPAVAGSTTAIVLLALQARKFGPKTRMGLLFPVLLLLPVAYMVTLQARGSTVLGHYPYASYLLPFVFLVMAAYFGPAVDSLTPRAYLMACGAAAIAFAALWYDSGRYLAGISPAAIRILILAAVAAFATSLLLRSRPAGVPAALAGFVAFAAIGLSHTVHFDENDLHGNRGVYQRIMQARSRVEALRHGRPLRFWYNQKEPDFYDFFGLDATYLAEFSRLGSDFPRDCQQPMPPDTVVVVVSQKEGAPELARSALTGCWQPFGVHPVLEGAEKLSGSKGPFTIATLHVEAGAAPAAGQERLLRTFDLNQARQGNQSVEQWPEGILLTTLPSFGAFAVQLPLQLDPGAGPGIQIRVRARVFDGKIGFGILDSTGKKFIIHDPMWPLPVATTLILSLPASSTDARYLVIDNQTNVVSKVLVERIEILQRP